MADEPPTGKLGKGDLVDAISLKAGVNKKTAGLVLGAGMHTCRATAMHAATPQTRPNPVAPAHPLSAACTGP